MIVAKYVALVHRATTNITNGILNIRDRKIRTFNVIHGLRSRNERETR